MANNSEYVPDMNFQRVLYPTPNPCLARGGWMNSFAHLNNVSERSLSEAIREMNSTIEKLKEKKKNVESQERIAHRYEQRVTKIFSQSHNRIQTDMSTEQEVMQSYLDMKRAYEIEVNKALAIFGVNADSPYSNEMQLEELGSRILPRARELHLKEQERHAQWHRSLQERGWIS